MPRYLVQLAYTPEAWAAQLRNPQNRIEVVAPALEAVGGRFEATYFAFGDYDVVLIMEAPDNTAAAAFGLAVAAGGAPVACAALGASGGSSAGRTSDRRLPLLRFGT